MSGVRMALLVLLAGAFALAGTASATPAFTCRDAEIAFTGAAEAYREAGPLPAPAPSGAAAEDQERNLPRRIQDATAARDAEIARKGAGSLEAARAHVALGRLMRLQALYPAALREFAAAEAISPRAIASRTRDGRPAARARHRLLQHAQTRGRGDSAVGAVDLHASGPARNPALEALNSQTLAEVLRGLSRFGAALSALRRAEAIYARDETTHARELAEVLIDTSIILTRLDDQKAAFATSERAVAFATERLGRYHRSTARALQNHGIHLRRNGAMSLSFAALGQAYAIYDALAVPVRAGETLEDVARNLARLKCYAEARRYEEDARARFIDQYGPLHVRVADAETRLGTYARDAGDLVAAEVYFNASIAIFDELLGPDNVRAAVVMRDLASVQSRAGDLDGAMLTLLGSIRSLEQERTPDELRESLLSLVMVLRKAGNDNAAILFAKKAVNTQQEIRAANKDLSPELAASFAERYRSLYLYLADL